MTGYNFYCKNDNNCPFNCFLEYSGKRNTKNEKLYKGNFTMINMKKREVLVQFSINFTSLDSKRFNNNTLKEISVFE